jgi:spore coat protein A, manganese oxidase
VPFGTSGDVPVAGDYDGDGRFDTAVFRPSSNNWFVQRSSAGLLIAGFGAAGDQPLPSVFVP